MSATAPLSRWATEFRFWLGLASVFAVSVGVLLMAATMAPRFAAGLQPTVVMTGSMAPSLRPGDVVLMDATAARPDVGAVIQFSDGSGDTIVHRVAEARREGIVTRGDANPTADSRLLAEADVTGVAVAVVPLVGLPLVWWQDSNRVALGILLGLGMAVSWSLASAGLRADPWSGPLAAPGRYRGPLTARALRDTGTEFHDGLWTPAAASAFDSAGVRVTGVAERDVGGRAT
jgi:signal peptidase I